MHINPCFTILCHKLLAKRRHGIESLSQSVIEVVILDTDIYIRYDIAGII